MSCNKENRTVSYDEKVGGFTSFHSFQPEYVIGMNNKFFSFNNGELYVHHSDNVPINNFYGVQYDSKISIMHNDNPSDIKELKTISLEGSDSWDVLVKAYKSNVDDFDESSVSHVEFEKKEGIWYAYARRNEADIQLDSLSTYGIGTISSSNGNDIIITGGSDMICVGDKIMNGEDFQIIGTITGHNTANNVTTITLDNPINLFGVFIVGVKNSRIDGGNLRGYTMRLDLTNSNTSKVELFAVNVNVMKSFS